MGAAVHTILALLALAFYNIEAGSFDESFLKSFKSDTDSKDAIIEFPEVLPTVLKNPALNHLTGDARRSKIVSLLRKATTSLQKPVLDNLATQGLADTATAFWVANRIAIKTAPLTALMNVVAIPIEFTIREAHTATLHPVEVGSVIQVQDKWNRGTRQTYQWGVDKIGAPTAFAKNITGHGVIVGVIDTGVQYTHEALHDNYKNDEFSWKDAVNNLPNPPYDDEGHGTHCAGIAVGTANGIGVAPGAKWIACKGLDSEGYGSETQLTTCGQFMACPKQSISGTCSEFPHIVSNSWGDDNDIGWYNSVIQLWRSLDIIPVFSIGNSGPACGTANSPGDQPNLISVGSTDINDTISSFSSRGPGGNVTLRPLGIGPIKPELVAPGQSILSASNLTDTGYVTLSGTSMAAPNVAGAAALILSADLKLTFNDVFARLKNTAVKITAESICTSQRAGSYPNNIYGYGRISVPKAIITPSIPCKAKVYG